MYKKTTNEELLIYFNKIKPYLNDNLGLKGMLRKIGQENSNSKLWKRSIQVFAPTWNDWRHKAYKPKKRIKKQTPKLIKKKFSHIHKFEGMKFYSTAELIWYLAHPGATKSKYIIYFDSDGKQHRYYPDFDWEGNTYEIKSSLVLEGKVPKGYNYHWEEKQKVIKDNNIIIVNSNTINPKGKWMPYLIQHLGYDKAKQIADKLKKIWN